MSEEQYFAVEKFEDKQDENVVYVFGTIYPREGYKPSPERVEKLLSNKNKRRKPVIARLKQLDPKPVEEDKLVDKTVVELKELADKRELEYDSNIKKAALIKLLSE